MSNRNRRNCGCGCNPIATVTSVTTTDTISTLTIDRSLLSLCFFRLCIPCATVSTILDDSTISLTDGTNTYTVQNALGNNLRADALKDRCCFRCRCGSVFEAEAFVGHDPDHVTVFVDQC